MQPEQAQAKPEEKNVQAQTATQPNTNSIETGSKSVEESGPEIKSEENKKNWQAYRAQMNLQRKEKEEAEKRMREEKDRADALKAALEAVVNKPSINHQLNNQASGYNEESEEERIQRKIDETVNKRLEQERLRFQEEQKQRELQEAPQRIAQSYPDFNNVVTTENCDYLDYHYPELTTPFKYMPEGFEKWSAMYRAIKKFVPNTDSKKDQAKADKNMQKPGSLSAPGVAQGQSAMPAARLDEMRKQSNWERMQRTLKGIS